MNTTQITKPAHDFVMVDGLRTITLTAYDRDGSVAWKDDVFRLGFRLPNTGDPRLRGASNGSGSYFAEADSPRGLIPSDHPIFTAAIGDTWQFGPRDGYGETPVYEYLGRFHVIDKILDPATEKIAYVLEEVVETLQSVIAKALEQGIDPFDALTEAAQRARRANQ